MLLDAHSHFLHDVDDGPGNIDETKEILGSALRSGITDIIATPHFYADKGSPEAVLSKREKAISEIISSGCERPKIYLASEVAYFSNISRAQSVKSLALEGTHFLFVEMPFMHWTDQIVKDVIRIQSELNLRVVLVHVDRYLSLGFKKYARDLLDRNIIFQWNAEYFLNKKFDFTLLKYFDKGWVKLLGSDLHNLGSRKENLHILAARLNEIDESIMADIEYNGNEIIGKAKAY